MTLIVDKRKIRSNLINYEDKKKHWYIYINEHLKTQLIQFINNYKIHRLDSPNLYS